MTPKTSISLTFEYLPERVSLLKELILLFGAGVGLQLFDDNSGESRFSIDLAEQNLSDRQTDQG